MTLPFDGLAELYGFLRTENFRLGVRTSSYYPREVSIHELPGIAISKWNSRLKYIAMDLHDAALVIAGIVGSTTAIVHGVVTQRQIVRPVHELTAGKLPQSIRRLVAALLHFSTFNWFVSGLALLIAVYSFGREARLATCLLVGSSYLYPALGNLWATRGRHVGWVLYTVAVLLIVYGLGKHGR